MAGELGEMPEGNAVTKAKDMKKKQRASDYQHKSK